MKLDLQIFRYESRFAKLQISLFEKYKNGWLFRRRFAVASFIKKTEKKSPSQSFKMYQMYVLGEKYLQKVWRAFPYSSWPAYHTGQGNVSLFQLTFHPLLNLIDLPFFSLSCALFFSQYNSFHFFLTDFYFTYDSHMQKCVGSLWCLLISWNNVK